MESSRFLEADPIDHELSQTSLCTVVFKKLASWGLCVSFFFQSCRLLCDFERKKKQYGEFCML